jgi:hypothetical protein
MLLPSLKSRGLRLRLRRLWRQRFLLLRNLYVSLKKLTRTELEEEWVLEGTCISDISGSGPFFLRRFSWLRGFYRIIRLDALQI